MVLMMSQLHRGVVYPNVYNDKISAGTISTHYLLLEYFDMIMIPYTIIHFPISRLFVILVSFEMSLIRLEAKKL